MTRARMAIMRVLMVSPSQEGSTGDPTPFRRPVPAGIRPPAPVPGGASRCRAAAPRLNRLPAYCGLGRGPLDQEDRRDRIELERVGWLERIGGRRSTATGWLAMLPRTAMSTPDRPDRIALPLSWVGYEEFPILYCNQLLIQFQAESSFVIGFGQATMPPLIGTPEEVAEQAADIEFVPVRTVARVALTPETLREVIAMLQANLENFERLQAQIDPRNRP